MANTYLEIGTQSSSGGSSFTAGGDLSGTSSSQTILSLTGTAGVVTGPSSGLTLGTTYASTGLLRLPKNTGINARNNANSADINIIKTDSADAVTIGSSSSPYVYATSGTSVRLTSAAVELYSSVVNFSEASTPVIGQDIKTSNAATNLLTIKSQAPYVSATSTNRNPGNIMLEVPAAISGGTQGRLTVKVNGGEVLNVHDGYIALNSIPATVGTIRLAAGGKISARLSTNATNADLIALTADQVVVGDPTAGTTVINGASYIANRSAIHYVQTAGGSADIHITTTTGTVWAKNAARTISQETHTTNTSCFDFTIQSQTPFASATSTNRNPGNLVLAIPAPAAGGTAGKLSIKVSGSETAYIGSGTLGVTLTSNSTIGAAGGASALPATPLGYMVINLNGTNVSVPYYNVS